MFLSGKVQVVITEDSDMLVFGVKKVMFKMDRTGYGTEIDMEKLQQVEELNMNNFTFEMF